ncbi:MAG: exonuclease domain-containing protein [Bacillota bacterium]|nr:exonuclease domain-containing protein [Bacillota bacterium]MDW7676757.1 exonuclease domain-containing protein [Bacillota bacterium]
MSIKFVAIDFETANARRNSACSLGMIQYEYDEYTRKSWLIKPEPLDFHPFNIQIHGITPQMVLKAPTFEEVWQEVSDVLESNIVVAHNAAFDMSVIRYSLDQYNLSYPSIDYLCTQKLAQKALPGLINYKLPTVARHIGFEFKHHDALEDAIAAAEVLIHLLDNHGQGSIESLAERFDICLGKIHSSGYLPCSSLRFCSGSYSKVDLSKLKPHTVKFDEDNLFYGKTVVFTGSLDGFSRADAAQLVVNMGGKVSNNVNRQTDFLILGEQDYARLTDGKTSSKMRKALDLAKSGHPIQMISERDFRENIML